MGGGDPFFCLQTVINCYSVITTMLWFKEKLNGYTSFSTSIQFGYP